MRLENSVWITRGRLAALWLSASARGGADSCFLMFAVLQMSRRGQEQEAFSWFHVVPCLIAPFVLLAPLHGAVSNSLPKRWVLAGSAGFCFVVTVLFVAVLGTDSNAVSWCLALALLVTGHAVYSATRYAVVPGAAQDAWLPLNRVISLTETGVVAGMIAGLVLAWRLGDSPWFDSRFPPAIVVAVVLNLVSFLTALPVCFLSDVKRRQQPGQALIGFFSDSRHVLRHREARGALFGLAGFLGLVAAGAVAHAFRPPSDIHGTLPEKVVLAGLGFALGSLLAGVQGHPRRALGLVPFAAIGIVAALMWAAIDSDLDIPLITLSLMGGLISVPLRTGYQNCLADNARGNAMSLMNGAITLCMAAALVLLFALVQLGVGLDGQLWLLAGLAVAAAGWAWWTWLRESLEQVLELLIWPLYRVRGRGPGLAQFPPRGPVLLVANHSAWLDPIWLGKVIPRRITAMMTSRFFDLPVLRWLLTHVARTIRVEAALFRREAPELQEAVAALDRGECVLIFPEAYMKRKTEQSLRQFGQGVWRILRERPATPVVVCWIEGGWGSFTSYYKGPPTVNKRLDWRRPIDVGVEPPQRLEPTLLADQRATRSYLMHVCVGARRHLGLKPLPLQQAESEEVLEAD
jgi:1-acyl-sn-glycerol-3-phosphate acyltransferase